MEFPDVVHVYTYIRIYSRGTSRNLKKLLHNFRPPPLGIGVLENKIGRGGYKISEKGGAFARAHT